MKKTISQRFFLSLCLMIVGCLWGSAAWATPGDVVYTLKCVYNSSNTAYNTNTYKVTYDGLTWITPGNQGPDQTNKTDFWRIGGKSLNNVDRTITGKNAISSPISKVTLAHNGINNTNAKINSVSLTVASDANFNNIIDNVSSSPSFSVGGTGTIDFTPTNGIWAEGSYYKLTINITNSNKNNNYGLDIASLTFYEGASGPALTTSTNSISFGSVEVNNNAVNNFTISGTKLTPSSTASLTIDDNTNFSVTPSTIDIDANGDIAAKNVTVTYAPTAAGVHNATLTISSGNLEKMVTLTGTGFVPHYISATSYYKKITSSDELVDGGQYVIVYTKGKKGLQAGANNVHDATPADVVFADNGTITTANAAAMTEITFEKYSTNTYHLKIGDNKYIKATSSTSSKTDLNVATGKDEYTPWVIAFDAAGNVEITSKKINNRGIMYSTNSTGYFKNYDVSKRGQAGYPAIQLYQKVGEMPIAKATGYVSTYVADFAYVMPKHITGHTVTLAAQQGVISTEKVFRADDEVPALTPLLIKSDEDYAAEENSRNYHPAVLNKTVKAYKDDNMLEYRRTAANLTNTMKNESVYYYKLAIKEGKVGFYWGADNGAAFKMTKPSTAYLTVPQSTSVQGFVLNLEEGEPTGIATVVTNEDAPIYNLQGIRMNGKNLPKGIYIQGGKKFMVK